MQYLRKVIISVVQYLKDTIIPMTEQRPLSFRYKNPAGRATRMKNQHGHGVCWMSAGTKKTASCDEHTLDCTAISRGNNSEGTQAILLVYVQEIMQTAQDLRIQQLEIKYLEIYARQHGPCVHFSQNSAEIKKNNAQDTDHRQDFFPSS